MPKRFLLLIASISLLASPIYSQNDYTGRLNAITTAVPFLLIAPESRGAGMGDVGCASSADAASQHYNPSKYVFNKNTFGISISYSPWLRKLVEDMNLLYFSVYWKVTENDAIAFSLRYFSLGTIAFTDIYGSPLGDQSPNEFALDFTYSRKLIDQLSLAITPRFIYSNLTMGQDVAQTATKAGLAGAADISLFYEQDFRAGSLHNSTLRAGLNISNMGNKISYTDGYTRDFIPTNLKLGIGYTLEFDPYNKLSMIAEFNKLLVPTPPIYTDSSDASGNKVIIGKDNNVSAAVGIFQSFADAPGGFREELQEIAWAIGFEYVYRELIFVRTGYFNESYNKGGRKYITIGAGVKYNILGIDVSYLFPVGNALANHPLESLRFTLTFDFASFNKNDIKNQGKLN